MLNIIKKSITLSLIIGLMCPLTAMAAPEVIEDEPVDLNEWIYIYDDLKYPDLAEDDAYGRYVPNDYEQEENEVSYANTVTDRGYLGATITNKLYRNKNATIKGALIEEVVANGPAKRAGLRAGDLITEINGFTVRTADDLIDRLSDTLPGQKIVITICNPQTDFSFKSEDYIVQLGTRSEYISDYPAYYYVDYYKNR